MNEENKSHANYADIGDYYIGLLHVASGQSACHPIWLMHFDEKFNKAADPVQATVCFGMVQTAMKEGLSERHIENLVNVRTSFPEGTLMSTLDAAKVDFNTFIDESRAARNKIKPAMAPL